MLSSLEVSENEVNEVTSFNQSVISTGQGRKLDKSHLVIKKEHVQTNIPLHPSNDQVMNSSQAVEISSCNNGKKRKVRGRNKLKQVASLEAGHKLPITFYNYRTVDENNNLFSRHLGKIVRDKNICPLGVASWNDIKQERLNLMWAAIKDKFESDELDIHRDYIVGWMRELWNKWRARMYATRVKGKSIQEALKNMPEGVDKKQWEWLVKEHWTQDGYQASSTRNASNRAKLKMLHHIGSRPIRDIIYQQGGKDGKPPKIADIFFETRKKNEILVDPESIEKHAQIKQLEESEPSLSTIEIIEKCFGPQNCSHVVGFGGGVKAKDMKSGTVSKTELLSKLRYKEEENQHLKERLSTVENDVKGLMKLKELLEAQGINLQPQTTSMSED